jgi:hypothetical protein
VFSSNIFANTCSPLTLIGTDNKDAKYRYNNVNTTVDGTDVDAIVTIVSIKDASIVLTIQPTGLNRQISACHKYFKI